MKVRESGMPAEEKWETFFDPGTILSTLGLDSGTSEVVEFGCGYGTFTIPAARMTAGRVHAIDIEPGMIELVREKASRESLTNILPVLRDFVTSGTGLAGESVDYAMLFNILHAEDPVGLLREAYRVLKPGGKAGVIHWNYDPSTPRGPPLEIRPRPGQCVEWGIQVGFSLAERTEAGPYHYGLVFRKPG